jgi:hypothetical protein
MELNVGVLPVDIVERSGNVTRVVMTQKKPEFGPTFEHAEVARVFGLAVDDLDTRFAPQVVSTGTPQLMVLAKSLDVRWGKPRQAGSTTVTPVELRSDGGLWLSAHLWGIPAKGKHPATIYLAEKQRRADTRVRPYENAACRRLASAGAIVLDLDPRGMGPYAEIYDRFVPLIDGGLTYDAFLLGRTLLGMRVADVVRGLEFLLNVAGDDAAGVGGGVLALAPGRARNGKHRAGQCCEEGEPGHWVPPFPGRGASGALGFGLALKCTSSAILGQSGCCRLG